MNPNPNIVVYVIYISGQMDFAPWMTLATPGRGHGGGVIQKFGLAYSALSLVWSDFFVLYMCLNDLSCE